MGDRGLAILDGIRADRGLSNYDDAVVALDGDRHGASGDMCKNAPKTCGNTARPGHHLCDGCIADGAMEKELVVQGIRDATDEHIERVLAQDEVVAV